MGRNIIITSTSGTGTIDDPKIVRYWTGKGWSRHEARGYVSKAGLKKATKRAIDSGFPNISHQTL
jgi:hypothetical protein